MAIPVNTSPANALPITALPYRHVTPMQDWLDTPDGIGYPSNCDAYQHHALWWKFTAGPEQTYVTLAASREDSNSTSNWPMVSLWKGPLTNLTRFIVTDGGETSDFCTSTSNLYYWLMVPMVPGETLWIQATFQAGTQGFDRTAGDLVFEMRGQPTATVPAGAIVIMDDLLGFPASALSPETGEILAFLDLPAGEIADTLPDGTLLLQDGSGSVGMGNLALFNGRLQRIGTIVLGGVPESRWIYDICSNQSTGFWVVSKVRATGQNYVTFYSRLGAMGQEWLMPAGGIDVACCSRDDTRLYYGDSHTANLPIKVFDLTTGTALPDLHVGYPNERYCGPADGYVAPDGTIWMGYTSTVQVSVGALRGFTPAGALVRTISTTPFRLNRWCGANDENAVWVWGWSIYPTPFGDYYTKYSLADGSILAAVGPVHENGASGESGQPWAISNSCPVFVLPVAPCEHLAPVACWNPHSLDAQQLRLNGEGQP